MDSLHGFPVNGRPIYVKQYVRFQKFPDSCEQGLIYGRDTVEQLQPKGFAFLFLINPDF